MSLFNKLTIFSILILMAAFVAVPVMAHQLPDAAEDATDAEKAVVTDHNNDPHDPTDSTVSADHALVKSIVVKDDKMYLTAAESITAIITLADGVAAIPNDPDTDDDPADPAAGDDNEARHGILPDHTSLLAISDISIQVGTMNDEGEYEYADPAVAANAPQVAAVTRTRAPGTGDTGSGAVYTVQILIPADLATAVDGMYKISVGNADVSQPDTATATATFMMDTKNPVVSNVMDRAIGTDYKNSKNQWEDPFELTFDVTVPDPADTDPSDGTDQIKDDSLDVDEFGFEAKVGTEVSATVGFGEVRRLNDKTFVVTVTPANVSTTETEPTEVMITVKAEDTAGNEGMGTTTVTLAPRTATTTGPVDPTDSEAPTVVSIEAPAAPIAAGQPNAGSLIFKITFSEALKDGTFTLSDLVISNVDTQTAHSTLVKDTADPKIYTLTVTPLDKTFPVKVSFGPTATVMDAAGNESIVGVDKDDTYTPKGVLGVDIKAPDKPLNGSLVFTFEFAQAPLPAIDAANKKDIRGFTISDVEASNAVKLVESNLRKSVSDDKIYYLTVTPLNSRLAVTVTLHADAVVADETPDDMANDDALIAGQGSATFTPDTTAPTLAITHTPADSVAVATGGMVTFTFTFTDKNTIETSGAGAFMTEDVAVVGGAKGTFTATNNKTYTLTVTPTTPNTNVTVTVAARSVTDTAIPPNAIAASVSETWTAPRIPGVVDDKPTLTITHDPADRMPLPDSGNVTFTFKFSEELGLNDNGFASGDVAIDGGDHVSFQDLGMVGSTYNYELVVKPTTPMTSVTVTVAADAVADKAGNNLEADKTETYMADDTDPPTVVITSDMGTGDNADKIVFKFTFSELLAAGSFTSDDLIRGTGVTLAGNPVMDSTNNKVYTVLVNPSKLGDTTLTLKTGSVMDMQDNALDGDQEHTYMPPTPNRAPAFASGASISAITATTGTAISNVTLPAATDADTGDTLTYSITPALPAGLSFNATSRVLSGTPSAAMTQTSYTYKVSDGSLSATLMFNITVNAAISLDEVATAMSSAVITIQPESFVVVVRDKNALNNQGIAFRSDVTVVEWGTMPNLERLFYRGNTGVILGNGGGGALILKESAAQTKDRRQGSVGISEIMWGIDAGYLGDETRDKSGQWIELHNLNAKVEDNAATAAVNEFDNGVAKVVLSWKTGRNITSDSTLIGNLSNPTLDVVTNFFNNRPGGPAWDVKGNSGDSVAGVNFKSMARILPDKKSKYANADGSRFDNRDGRNAGHWQASSSAYLTARTTRTDATDVVYQYLGTPGRVNHVSVDKQPNTVAGRTNVPSNTIVVNEVGNNSNDDYDWVEIRNVSDGEINLKNYLITMVRDSNTETVLARFPANDSAKLAKDDVFLLLKTDPAKDGNHPIAATGYNVGLSLEEQQPGTPNSPVRYRVFSSLTLPNDDGQKFVLIVRKPDSGHNNGPGGHKDQGTSETASTAHGPDLQHIVDVAGYDDNVNKSNYPNAVSSTSLWPLHNFAAPRSAKNTFKNGVVLQRNRLTTKHGLGGTGIEGDDGNKPAFGIRGWTGVGYRRAVANTGMHGGTPGYPNGASHGAGTTIITAVYISEIMYTDARNGTLPQWIEIRNTSNTEGADLHNWRLTIKNHADKTTFEDGEWDGKYEASVLLRDLKIKPNSSVLVTSRKGPRSDVHLADNEIFSLFPSHRSAFGMTNANSDVINPFGFRITLHANGHEGDRNKWQLVDDVGNLATPNPRDRRGNNERLDMPRWALPDAVDDAGNRSSIARRNNKVDGLLDGSMASAWVLSSIDGRTNQIDYVYYGHIGDMSTPGQTKGSPLPVRLSFFRPTLEDGKVVIRWTTEAELDNAGFNILRSQDRNGEFTQVNDQLIQGKGTTAERSNYNWVDTSAKPGAVYYYQIEDVSFAGERQTLTTTKMKGLISAKNKLTTKWGELKEVQ